MQVPLDALERTFGALAGYDFDWQPALRRLVIERMHRREVRVGIDTVHIRGTTTVVLQFPEEAPRYRIVTEREQVEVLLLGDRAVAQDPVPSVSDPLVRSIDVRPDVDAAHQGIGNGRDRILRHGAVPEQEHLHLLPFRHDAVPGGFLREL